MSREFDEQLSLLQSRFTVAVIDLATKYNEDKKEAMKHALEVMSKAVDDERFKEFFE